MPGVQFFSVDEQRAAIQDAFALPQAGQHLALDRPRQVCGMDDPEPDANHGAGERRDVELLAVVVAHQLHRRPRRQQTREPVHDSRCDGGSS